MVKSKSSPVQSVRSGLAGQLKMIWGQLEFIWQLIAVDYPSLAPSMIRPLFHPGDEDVDHRPQYEVILW